MTVAMFWVLLAFWLTVAAPSFIAVKTIFAEPKKAKVTSADNDEDGSYEGLLSERLEGLSSFANAERQ